MRVFCWFKSHSRAKKNERKRHRQNKRDEKRSIGTWVFVIVSHTSISIRKVPKTIKEKFPSVQKEYKERICRSGSFYWDSITGDHSDGRESARISLRASLLSRFMADKHISHPNTLRRVKAILVLINEGRRVSRANLEKNSLNLIKIKYLFHDFLQSVFERLTNWNSSDCPDTVTDANNHIRWLVWCITVRLIDIGQ